MAKDKITVCKNILKKRLSKLKQQVSQIIETSVNEFYGAAGPGNYSRTNSFQNFKDIKPSTSWDVGDNTVAVTLTYTFSSDKVSVNPWESPWGITYDGDPEKAFITAFDDGFHGGPKPLNGLGNGWYWDATQQTTPILDLIWSHIGELTI